MVPDSRPDSTEESPCMWVQSMPNPMSWVKSLPAGVVSEPEEEVPTHVTSLSSAREKSSTLEDYQGKLDHIRVSLGRTLPSFIQYREESSQLFSCRTLIEMEKKMLLCALGNEPDLSRRR
ncbi:hypothetical protein AVEN_247946-1 [Araneus ventricosus]|uniref:Uncharacterized protein n=1 Tax=Araneus ventricosus TaxID=182803 RepID=A0A4Y2CJG7_ARAVE|nr:hypothetical protein AVEN_247946-1 [Araneus ventricosus]